MGNYAIDLLQEIQKANDQYYNEGTSIYTDEEYDAMVKLYKEMTGEDPSSLTAPTVGKKLVDVSHTFPTLVGTLSKAFTIEEVYTWLDDIYEKLGLAPTAELDIALSEKYDGNSVVLSFNSDYTLYNALTRGAEGKGLDLTDFFWDRKLIQPDIDIPEGHLLGVKCEAIITYEDFEKIMEVTGKSYANPRNMVAGILNSNDGYKLKEYISLVPLTLQFYPDYPLDRLDTLESLTESDYMTKSVPLNVTVYSGTLAELKELLHDAYQEAQAARSSLPYMIDGLVLEVVDMAYREQLGRLNDRNKFDIALKFPYMTKRTKMVDIEWYTEGNTGRYTPVAVVEPVVFNGAVCDHISLANYDRFYRLQLRKGQDVIIEYRSDVLAYLTPAAGTPEEEMGEVFKAPTTCISCSSHLELNETGSFLSCINPECEFNKIGYLTNWLTKTGVKGIKSGQIAKLMESDLPLDSISDLYKTDIDSLTQVPGFKEKSAQNFYQAIHAKKKLFDYEVLGSLSFPNMGHRVFKEVFREYKLEDLLTWTKDSISIRPDAASKLLNIKGWGALLVAAFETRFPQVAKDLLYILTHQDFEILSYKDSIVVDPDKQLHTIVFTGFRDADLQKQLEGRGHKVTSGVTVKTSYVVTKDPEGRSSKLKKAKELNIQIITPAEVLNLISTNIL